MQNPTFMRYWILKYQKSLTRKPSIALWEFCSEQLDRAKMSSITAEAWGVEKVKLLLLGSKAMVSYGAYKDFKD